MSGFIAGAAILALAVGAIACLKISEWHRQESDYWSSVAWKVRLNPRLDEHYRPILTWAQAERPTLLARLRAWRSPEDRIEVSS